MTKELVDWLKSHSFNKPDVFQKLEGIYEMMLK